MAARGLVAALLIATPMAVVSTPASADPVWLHVTYKGDLSPVGNEIYKSVKVVCPARMKIIGGSFHLNGAPGDIVLDDFIPYDTPLGGGGFESGLIVGAGQIVGHGEHGTSKDWSVEATAVCADPPPGYSIRPVTSGVGSPSGNTAVSPCPPARQVLGGGASLSQGFGQVSINHLSIDHLNTGTKQVQARALEDVDGFPGNWSVTAYAICADPVANWRVVPQLSSFSTDVALTAAAFCPRGQLVIGSLWSILTHRGVTDGRDRYVTSTQLSRFPDPGVTVNVLATGEFGTPIWRTEATAVCADGTGPPQ